MSNENWNGPGSAGGGSSAGSYGSDGSVPPAQDGQSAYGQQPAYGQPAYGQSAYGQQPAYGQQAPGQPAYGQQQYGEPQPYGQNYGPGGGYGAAPSLTQAELGGPRVGLPAPLATAVKLMYAGAAIAVLSALSNLLMRDAIHDAIVKANETATKKLSPADIDTATTSAMTFGLIFGLIGAGLWVLTAQLNKRGKKWARVMATIFAVLSVLSLANTVAADVPLLIKALSLVSTIVGVAAAVLLWAKANNPYYEQNSRPRV